MTLEASDLLVLIPTIIFSGVAGWWTQSVLSLRRRVRYLEMDARATTRLALRTADKINGTEPEE